MAKKVFKYGTGEEIPEGAVFLSTITEDIWAEECIGHCSHHTDGSFSSTPEMRKYIEKRLVWHYFLVQE